MNAHPSISVHRPSSPIDHVGEVDSLETDNTEDEVDQLVSDSDEDVPMADVTSSPKRTRPKVAVERVPGRSVIPLAKVEGILEADGEGEFLSKEAIYLLTVATEEFVKRLAQAGQRQASSSKRLQVNYRDLASTTHQHPEFKFLEDTIPEPISLAEALKLRASKEKELLEDGSATAATSKAHTPVPSVASSIPQPSKAKGKGRQPSHKSAESASAGAPSRRPRQRKSRQAEPTPDSSVRDPPGTGGMTTRRRSSRATLNEGELPGSAPPGSPYTNGHHSSQNGVETPSHPQFLHPSASSTSTEQPPSWGMPPTGSPPGEYANGVPWPPTPYTGPASGYMEDHRMIFNGRGGVNGMTANPGRTIYSHRQQSR
ncbi:unnamed protein product [Somion occarium]|uniref:Transcription factor CBF/NF-Y/archaeal histone domain-containing protein n=1 Tax=Somion occarium TaxID=3059160 RepID=A0ABP1DZT3_9APHY